MLSKALGFLGRAFIIVGLFILGFVAFQLWGTSLEEGRNQSELTDQLAHSVRNTAKVSSDGDAGKLANALAKAFENADPATAPPTPAPAEGEPVGVIQIPKIGLERVIVQGVSKKDLKKGPGHYPGTPLPGQAGNSGIAGHRTTYGAPFNRIDELAPGDEITITTPQGRFLYKVIKAPDSDAAPYIVKPTGRDRARRQGRQPHHADGLSSRVLGPPADHRQRRAGSEERRPPAASMAVTEAVTT